MTCTTAGKDKVLRDPLSTDSDNILGSSHNNPDAHSVTRSRYRVVTLGHAGCDLLNSAPAAPPADSPGSLACSMFGIVVVGGRSHLGSAPLAPHRAAGEGRATLTAVS